MSDLSRLKLIFATQPYDRLSSFRPEKIVMRRLAPPLSAAATDRWRDAFGKVYLCLGPLMLMCAAPLAVFAQYRFDHWTADNGLPQYSVRDIVLTRDGHLWPATFDGLARFDGVRSTVFSRAAGGSDVTTEKK